MNDIGSSRTQVIDVLIYVFFIIFLLSFGNSIFVNQVGYFGALILLLIKIAVTKHNQFSSTGLEIAIVLYILALILSAIFSEYPLEALSKFVKRAAVIPILYTTIAVTRNFRWGKRYFLIYIGGILVVALVYFIFSVEHYLSGLYQTEQAGPSVFQHQITTGEVLSFAVLFLFAFLINEKTSIHIKLFTLFGFLLSLVALIATFKRTGWIGTTFGIVVILIITRQWKTLLVVAAFVAVLFVVEKNKSEVIVFSAAGENLKKLYSFETEGRAYNFTRIDGKDVIIDFENGLSFYEGDSVVKNIKLSAPISSFTQLADDYFLALMYDTRFLILKRVGMEFREVNELLSPGYTKVFKIENEMLYVLDSDSGLTVFADPYNNDEHYRYPELNIANNIFLDSSFLFVEGKDGLQIRVLKDYLPTLDIIRELSDPLKVLKAGNNRILINRDNKIELLDYEFKLIDSASIPASVTRVAEEGENLYLLTVNKSLLKLENYLSDSLRISALYNLGYTPNFLYAALDRIYISNVERSRFLSIFDPYTQSNFTRLALWRAGWEMFKDNPLFGVGDVDLAKYYLKYKRPVDKEIHGHLHNNYIHFLAALGLFGFLAIVFLFVKMFMILAKQYKESKGSKFINSIALGAIAGLAATLVAGLTELNFWDHEIATMVYFTVGLSIALCFHHKNENDDIKKEIK